MSALTIGVVFYVIAQVVVILRVLTRPHREPAARIAWLAIIAVLPLLGILLYVLFGEVSIGRQLAQRRSQIIETLRFNLPAEYGQVTEDSKVPQQYRHLVQTGKSISYFEAVSGNSGQLLADSNATIEAMVQDIDAARDHVHLLFYIWLPDNNGRKIAEALKRAASRGIKCRAMADDLGSRTMIRSEHWRDMRQAGVQVVSTLPIGNPLLRVFAGRLDLRNHRKIVVIDNGVTYCGSQNCADPEFLVKAKYAPWVDAVMRLEGPVARQNQYLFACDWIAHTDEDLSDLISQPFDQFQPGFSAQVIGTGPTVRFSAMPEMFESLFHAARNELIISTPYFVPNEPIRTALCAAAYRGVDTKIIFPARNDSWVVAGASRSYYQDLLESGVQIYEYVGGLLHAKTLTLDGEVTLIGSANMDRRSFDLNYENNILLFDSAVTQQLRHRQRQYIDRSKLITKETVDGWPLTTRVWNNALATVGPIL